MVVPPASPLSSFVLSCLFPFSRTKSSFLLAASLPPWPFHFRPLHLISGPFHLARHSPPRRIAILPDTHFSERRKERRMRTLEKALRCGGSAASCFWLWGSGGRSVGRSHRHHHRITIEAAAATEIKWAEKLQSPTFPPPPQTVRAREGVGLILQSNMVVWESFHDRGIPQFSEAVISRL